jgi:hypothetical protein
MTTELDDLIRLTAEEVYGPENGSFEDEGMIVHDFGFRDGGWFVGFPSDYVVVGTNPEMADMSNPRGEIIRERFSIVAEDAKGHRRAWGGLYDSPEAAEAAYSLEAPPVDLWDEIRPAYGSEAYAENWEEYEGDQIERECEEDGGYFIVTGLRR